MLRCGDDRAVGIIPAYAGSTHEINACRSSSWDHPRICGEHVAAIALFTPPKGSSPHMRGAQKPSARLNGWPGIIPAYAGSTYGSAMLYDLRWDHPRICGEHDASEPVSAGGAGSSPHMRGAQEFSAISNEVSGIIPAYAGSTFCVVPSNTRRKDHPRICGEHLSNKVVELRDSGSSPHMRGAPELQKR